MARAPIKFLVEDVDRHGNVRTYLRRPGHRKVRIKEKLGTPEFWEAYRAAMENPAPAPAAAPGAPATPGSFHALCLGYYKSAEYKGLSERTRYVRKRALEAICARDGSKPYRLIEARHIRARRDERAETPEAANATVKTLRQLFAWAMAADLMKSNPARDVPYIKTGSEGFHRWTPEEIRQFEARHPVGTKARLALALLAFTGTRRSDVIGLGRQMTAEGWLRFTEAKGRDRKAKQREIPILPELQSVIDATPSGHLNFLTTAFGKPYTVGGFGNWFRRRCDEAGLPHCSAHGLRKAGATIAADNGATEHQLMAIFGWDSPKQAALYTRTANRKRLAGDAMHLLVTRQIGNETVPLQTDGAASGTKNAKKTKGNKL